MYGRPTIIDLNHPFIISLDKCNGNCDAAINDLSMKICVPSKRKDVNAKEFYMITRRIKAKMLVKHISCDCKCKYYSLTCNSNQKGKNGNCQCDFKKYCACKEDYR